MTDLIFDDVSAFITTQAPDIHQICNAFVVFSCVISSKVLQHNVDKDRKRSTHGSKLHFEISHRTDSGRGAKFSHQAT